jgi:hypothetical protein
MKFDLIPMLSKQINQSFSGEVSQASERKTLSTGVSFQYLECEAEDISLNDSAVGSGQLTEKNLRSSDLILR